MPAPPRPPGFIREGLAVDRVDVDEELKRAVREAGPEAVEPSVSSVHLYLLKLPAPPRPLPR